MCNGSRHLAVVHKKARSDVVRIREVMRSGGRPENEFGFRKKEFVRQQKESAAGVPAIGGQWVNGSGVVGGSGHQIFVPDVETVMEDLRELYDRMLSDDPTDQDYGTNDYEDANGTAADDDDEEDDMGSSRPSSSVGNNSEAEKGVTNGESASSPVNDHICRGCGKYFPRAAAKLGHEKSCPLVQKRSASALSQRPRKRQRTDRPRPSLDEYSQIGRRRASVNGSASTSSVASSIADVDCPSLVKADPVESVTKETKKEGDNHVELAKQLFESNQIKSSTAPSFGIEMDQDTKTRLISMIDPGNRKCNLCPGKPFAAETLLVHHAIKEHIKRSIFKCKGCPLTTISLKDLDAHLLNQHGIKSMVQRSKLMINLSNPYKKMTDNGVQPPPNVVVANEPNEKVQTMTKELFSFLATKGTPDTVTKTIVLPDESPAMPGSVSPPKVTPVVNSMSTPSPKDQERTPILRTPVQAKSPVVDKESPSNSTVEKTPEAILPHSLPSSPMVVKKPLVAAAVPSPPSVVVKPPPVVIDLNDSPPPRLVVPCSQPMRTLPLVVSLPKPNLIAPATGMDAARVKVTFSTSSANRVPVIVSKVADGTTKAALIVPASTPATASMATPPFVRKADLPTTPVKVAAVQEEEAKKNDTFGNASSSSSATGHHHPLKLVLQRTSPPEDIDDEDDGQGHHHHHRKKKKSKKTCYTVTATLDE